MDDGSEQWIEIPSVTTYKDSSGFYEKDYKDDYRVHKDGISCTVIKG